MEKYIDIGKRLKELRGSVSQKEFAKRLGISYIAYQNYEYGKRVPPGTVLTKIADICNVTVDYILTGDEESLYKHMIEKEYELAKKKGEIEVLDKELRRKLSKRGVPLPKNISSFLEVANFYKKYGIDILSLIEKQIKSAEGKADIVSEKILLVLKDMDEEKRRDILKYAKEKKQLMELLTERRGKEAG